MKARRGVVMGAVALSLVGMVAAYRLGKARADGVPAVNPLYYGGVLSDGGRPVEGMRAVTVRLWDAATAGTTVCSTSAAGTTFTGGRFRVALDAACVGAVRANPELWAEVQVEGTTFPRSKLGAVPYALEAGRATGAAGALEARIAAVEGRPTGGRQVVIGSWRPASGLSQRFTIPCTAPDGSTTIRFPVVGAPFAMTFTAAATALYRIRKPAPSATTFSETGGGIVSLQLEFESSPPITTALRAGEDLYQLTAGQTYTLSVVAVGTVGCRVPEYPVDVEHSFIIEQFN